MGHYKYKIESTMKNSADPKIVYRRYTEFVELQKLLKLVSPGSILHPLPEKQAMNKV